MKLAFSSIKKLMVNWYKHLDVILKAVHDLLVVIFTPEPKPFPILTERHF